jgi:hypothetical protein
MGDNEEEGEYKEQEEGRRKGREAKVVTRCIY